MKTQLDAEIAQCRKKLGQTDYEMVIADLNAKAAAKAEAAGEKAPKELVAAAKTPTCASTACSPGTGTETA